MAALLTVRRTKQDDGRLLRSIRVASLTDAPYAFAAKLEDVLAQSDEAFEETARRHATSDVSTSFLLFSGSELLGIVGAFFDQSEHKRPFICALWVTPEYRGTSAATMLVSTAIDWLRVRGAQGVFAWVANANSRAMAFYRKLGFVPTEEVQPLPSDPSQLETLLRLSKSVS